jgi:hypothetical protein
LIDKELQKVNQVFILIVNPEDSFLLDYAQKLIYNNNSQLTIFDVNGHLETNFVLQSSINSLKQQYPKNISLQDNIIVKSELLALQDLMIISIESWKSLVDSQSVWLSSVPSVLILKH